MLINNIISSISESCGISIFSRHLSESLTKRGYYIKTTNISSNIDSTFKDGHFTILHYVPSSFSTERSSNDLIKVLHRVNLSRLIVIFHGAYKVGENRFVKDTISPFQNEQLKIIFNKSSHLIALSRSVENNLKTWMTTFKLNKIIYRLNHPGLFISFPTISIDTPYAFLGGILRPKKNYNNENLFKLLNACKKQNLAIWMHWSNLSEIDFPKNYNTLVWKNTIGLQSDKNWTNIISNARIILCPYQTRIQSVSGLIAEAISAHCFILATTFDYSIEMKNKYPFSVILNNDLDQWPRLIEELLKQKKPIYPDYYNWDKFVKDFISISMQSQKEVLRYNYNITKYNHE